MIVFLKGKIQGLSTNKLTLDVNGVGYECMITLTSYEDLIQKKDKQITISIYHHITDSNQSLFGFLDDKLGGKNTIQISNIALITSCVIAVLAQSKEVFWVSGIILGIFSGPNQAASRSLMGRLIPKEKVNEFYGFYAFSGKATSFLGPLLLGLITYATSSQRWGIATVIIFLIIGTLLLKRVNDKEKVT